MIVPGNSIPLMMTVTSELLVSTMVAPSSGFEKNVGVGSVLCGDNNDFNPSTNLGTNWKSQPSGSIIWHCCKACHVGLLSVLPIGSSRDIACSFNSFAILGLACCTDFVPNFQIASCVSHSAVFPFDRVVTCCTSNVTSAIIMLIVGCFSLTFTGIDCYNALLVGNNRSITSIHYLIRLCLFLLVAFWGDLVSLLGVLLR